MIYGDWVMIITNGPFVHPNKAKKAISLSQKPSINDGLSCFFSLLGIEEWRGEKELLEKKDRKKWKERRAGFSRHPGWVIWVPYSVPYFFCFSGTSFPSRFDSHHMCLLVPSLAPWQSPCLIHMSHPRQSHSCSSFSLLALVHAPGCR